MILRIGTRKLDAGGQHDIAERAFGDKASRHARGRWLRDARQVFSVANDLVSGGERVRAIQVLLDVVHVVDALWLTGTYELPERNYTRYCRRRRVLWDLRWDDSTLDSGND